MSTALVAALALQVGAARADEDEGKTRATELMSEANQRMVAGDYVGALARFKEAYSSFPSPRLLLNIGTALLELGRNIEAVEAYERYLRDPGADPAHVEEIARIVADTDATLGHLRIEVAIPGASVRLDGKLLKGLASGAVVRVEPGEHTVVAERAGAAPVVQTVDVPAKVETTIALREPPRVAERPRAPETVEAVPFWGAQRVIGVVVGVGGVVAAGAGAFFGLKAMSKGREADGHCLPPDLVACDPKGKELDGEARDAGLISTIDFIAAGSALATSGALLLTAPSPKPPARRAALALALTCRGAATRDGAAISIGGTW